MGLFPDSETRIRMTHRSLAKQWLSLLFIFLACTAQSQIDISIGQTPEEYVNDILLGEGVTASNVSFTGSEIQIGFMEGAAGTIFPIDEGLVLSCDHASNSDPDFPDETIPIGEGISGDADLLEIANDVPPLIGQFFTVGAVNDLAILEFDFVATGDTISFNYSFGSDEYLTWVNSQYNDIFAFLLSGPGLVGPYDSPAGFPDGAINIAQVPDSDPPLPITVSSVNPEINDEYYIDNPTNTDIAINGFTVKLTASAEVICGETYHIKLAIADGTDTALESIVVLESGSFASNNPAQISSETNVNTNVDLPTASVLEGCVDGSFLFTIDTDVLNADTLFYEIGGTAENGVDYEEIDDFIVLGPDFDGSFDLLINPTGDGLTEGDETVTITYVFTNSCGISDTSSASLNIIDLEPVTITAEDIFICPESSETSASTIAGGFGPYDYSWSSGGTAASESFDHGSAGSYTVNVTDLCEQSATASITVQDGAVLTVAEPEDWYCLGISTAQMFAGGVAPVEFTFDQTQLSVDGNASFSAGAAGVYTVAASDACGQNVSENLEWVVCDTQVPNVFTPGNDQMNDFFVIDGLEGFPESSLLIYNRWGNLVFESTNYLNDWSGVDSSGNELNQGTYYYVFQRSDGNNYSGDLSLMRKP